MTTLEVINHPYKAGLSVALQQGERINLKPTNLVTPALVNLVSHRVTQLDERIEVTSNDSRYTQTTCIGKRI